MILILGSESPHMTKMWIL